MDIISLQTGIADAVKGKELSGIVIQHFADLEIKRRSDMLIKGFDQLNSLEKDMKKIRADVETFDADGKVLTQVFSKAKNEERKKLVERITNLKSAIEAALNTADFNKLSKCASASNDNKNNNNGGNSKPAASSDNEDSE